MVLKFNSFRAERYLRSRFLEGRFLLASENTDLQLEMIDKSRETVRNTLGLSSAIEDGWKVEKYKITTTVTNVAANVLTVDTSLLDLAILGDEVSKNDLVVDTITSIDTGANTITMPTIGTIMVGDTIVIRVRNSVLVKPGDAFFDGLPFYMQGGQDALVSGSNRSLGITINIGGGAANITAIDDPDGAGKIINFNSGGSTSAGTYRVVVSAIEEVITSLEDPFLQNANIPESTAQKLRLTYRLNIVPETAQSESPVPYTDANTSGNLINKIIVNPISGGEGSEISRTTITGSEQIDGRNLEITIRNTTGSNKLPAGTIEQSEYTNGRFIDSLGNEYHLNLITNGTVANTVILRVDKSPGQQDPVIQANVPYTLIKRDVFVTDDVNGNPQGALYFPLATVDLTTGSGVAHDTDVVDLRNAVISKEDFEEITNTKFNLRLTDGGTIDFEVTDLGGTSDDILSWSSPFVIINPHGPQLNIPANTVALVEGASIAYFLSLDLGGPIEKGNLALTSEAELIGATTIDLQGSPNLEEISIGNMVRIEGYTRVISDVDDVAKTITLSSGLPAGISAGTALTVFLDTYAQGLVPLTEDTFILATRNNNKVYFSNLELSSGESSNIGSSIPQALLDYIGSPSENTSTPDYATPQVTDITLGAPATIDDSEYFFISGGQSGDRYYVWFNKSGVAVDPAPSGAPAPVGVEVNIAAAVSDEDVAEAVRLALDTLADFTATRTLAEVEVTDVVDGPNQLPNNVNIGAPFAISATVGSPTVVTDGTSLTQGIIDLDKGVRDLDDLLDQPIYEETDYFAAATPALTTLDLPPNSRNFDKPLQIVSAAGALEVFANGIGRYEGVDWILVSENGSSIQGAQIRFNYELPADTVLVYRLDSLGGSTSPVISIGGGTSWADPVDASIIPDTDNTYDLGAPGFKFKDGYFAGKLTVDGVIDPTGLELVPQASDPLATGQAGIWINTSDQLIQRKTDNSDTNITQRLDDLESGTSNPIQPGTALTKSGNTLNFNTADDSLTVNTNDAQVRRDPAGAVTLSVAGIAIGVDNTGIEIDSNALRLKDLGVTTAKLNDQAVTAAKIASSALNGAAGMSGGAGGALSVKVDSSTITFDGSGNLQVSNIPDNVVTSAKLAASTAGNGLSGGGGTPYSVNVDNQTLQIVGDTLSVIGADSLEIDAVAGESFAADTTFVVRFAISGETAGRIYKADSADASTLEFSGLGIVNLSSAATAGDAIKVKIIGSSTLGSSDVAFASADIGKDVFVTTAGGFSITPPTATGAAQYVVGKVETETKLFILGQSLRSIVPDPYYDERTLYPTGAAINDIQTIPVNSRNAGAQETYNTGDGDLKVFINQKLAFSGTEYDEISSTQVQWKIALPNDTEIHWRKERPVSGILSVGAGGGGSGTLQDAYDNGRFITTTSGNPFVINGPASEKLLVINGDIDVTGVIDPTAIQLTPQASNPLGPTDAGIFVESASNDLCFEDGVGGSTNITASITALESASNRVIRTNNTASTIPAFTPVFSPSAGNIEPANGNDDNKFRVIGITAEEILSGQSGSIAIGGELPGVAGFVHNSLIYLDSTIGTMTDDATGFPADFHIVRLGVIDGTNLLIQIEQLGTTA